jgi:hypothetical protein
MLGGVSRVGSSVSFPTTVILWLHDAEPTPLVAVHSMNVTPAGYGAVKANPSLRSLVTTTPGPVVVGVPISASVAVYVHPLLEVNVLLDGQLMVGASSDVTTIVCTQVAIRPNWSVAVQVMKVVPIGYGSVTGRSSLLSLLIITLLPVAEGVPTLTVASDWPDGAATVWFAGQVIVGAAAATTVTVKVQLPPPTEDVTVTTVVPSGKVDPDAGLAVTVPQLPMASALGKVTTAAGLPPWVVFAATVMFGGQSSTHSAGVPPPPPMVMGP